MLIIEQKKSSDIAFQTAIGTVGNFSNHLEMSSFASYIDRGDYKHIIEVFNSLEAASRDTKLYSEMFFDWLYDYNSRRFLDFIKYFTRKNFEMTKNNYSLIADVLVNKIQQVNDVINAHNQFVKNINNVGNGVAAFSGIATANSVEKER